MKKTLSVILTIILLSVSVSAFASPLTVAEAAGDEIFTSPTAMDGSLSAVMAINEPLLFFNDETREIAAPLLIFDKTYVDLYDFASVLNYEVKWIEDYIGYFNVVTKTDSVDFTLVNQYTDLKNEKYKFFTKDQRIYVALRELLEISEYSNAEISYEQGIITVGVHNNHQFADIAVYPSDDYVYTAYPVAAEYVVNPFQEYSYETMLQNAEALQAMYPDLIRLSSIGKSVENRELLLIEFGKGENKIFVCGTHHAREYIATTYLMYAIDRYSYAYRTDSMWGKYSPKDILDKLTFCIVPMVNPDGVNLVQNGVEATTNAEALSGMKIYEGSQYGYSAWKANINGVDVNWNYDKDWYLSRNKNSRGSTGFNGYHPNSEPETIAVSNYVDSHKFEAFMSFHTQGQIFYWADDVENPTYIDRLISADTGFACYREGATGVGGSFFDYVYRKYGKATITVELCPYVGNYPYPNNDFQTVWKPAQNVLLIVGNEILYRLN